MGPSTEWSIYSASQNLAAVLNDPNKGKQSNFFVRTWGDHFIEKIDIRKSQFLAEINFGHFENYLRKHGRRYKKHSKIKFPDSSLQNREKTSRKVEFSDKISILDEKGTFRNFERSSDRTFRNLEKHAELTRSVENSNFHEKCAFSADGTFRNFEKSSQLLDGPFKNYESGYQSANKELFEKSSQDGSFRNLEKSSQPPDGTFKHLEKGYQSAKSDFFEKSSDGTFRNLEKVPRRSDFSDINSIPEIFLRPNLPLNDQGTFNAIFPCVNLERGGTAGGTLSAKESGRLIQERLSHFLDIVEVEIAYQVAQKSADFFYAMKSHDSIMEQMSLACVKVKDLRMVVKRMDSNLTNGSLRLLGLVKSRKNRLKTLDKLKMISCVLQTQPTLQLLLSNSDYVGALELIMHTQAVLASELAGITALRHLPSQLKEMSRLIDKMLNDEFVKYICADLNRPLTRLENLTPDRLTSIIAGLLRQKNLLFLEIYKKEAITSAQAILKQITIEQIADSSEKDLRLTGSADSISVGSTLNSAQWLTLIEMSIEALSKLALRVKDTHDVIKDISDLYSGKKTEKVPISSINPEKVPISSTDPEKQSKSSTDPEKVNILSKISSESSPNFSEKSKSSPNSIKSSLESENMSKRASNSENVSESAINSEKVPKSSIDFLEESKSSIIFQDSENGRTQIIPSENDLNSVDFNKVPNLSKSSVDFDKVPNLSKSSVDFDKVPNLSKSSLATEVASVGDPQNSATSLSIANLDSAEIFDDSETFLTPDDLHRIETKLRDLLTTISDYFHDRIAKMILDVSSNVHITKTELSNLQNLIESFSNLLQNICGRNSSALTIAFNTQATKYVSSFHNARKKKLMLLLDAERWRVAEIPSNFQTLVDRMVDKDCVLGGDDAECTSNTIDGSTIEFLEVAGEKFITVGVVLMLLRLISEYCRLVYEIPSQTLNIGRFLSELLKTFNSRSCQLILGANALKTAGLKTITTTNLALASRSLQLIKSITPQLRKYFTNFANDVPGLDFVEREVSQHIFELEAKIINIMNILLTEQLNEWTAKPPVPSAPFRTISKHLLKLHEAVNKILPQEQINEIYTKIHKNFKDRLRDQIIKMNISNDGGPKHGAVTSELMFYVETLKKLNVIPNEVQNMDDIWSKKS